MQDKMFLQSRQVSPLRAGIFRVIQSDCVTNEGPEENLSEE